MKRKLVTRRTSSDVGVATAIFRRLASWMRQVPRRVQEARFWVVQIMLLTATGIHYSLEAWGHTAVFDLPHHVSTSLYIVPILYATLVYRFEGTVLTGLWAILLAIPGMIVWHPFPTTWPKEMFQLTMIVVLGSILAWRVENEAEQRQRAETTSARLALLNEIGARLTQTPQVEQALPDIVERLQQGLDLDAAWLHLEGEATTDGKALSFQWGIQFAQDGDSHDLLEELNAQVLARGQPARLDSGTVAVPLLAEGRVLGSLGAVVQRRQLAEDEVDLLTTIARQIGVAVDNALLYRQRQESLQSYARQVTQAQEDERRRIARELHDETAVGLVLILRGLGDLTKPQSRPMEEAVADLIQLTRDTLQSIRRFSRDLRPSVLDDLGLVPALEWLVGEAQKGQRAEITFRLKGEPRRLQPERELALFRIAQEALRNVEKHARAEHVRVSLTFQQSGVRLCISDDGCGFQAPASLHNLAQAGKLGILGMKERAELVGASFEIASQPEQGTTVCVYVATAQELPAWQGQGQP